MKMLIGRRVEAHERLVGRIVQVVLVAAAMLAGSARPASAQIIEIMEWLDRLSGPGSNSVTTGAGRDRDPICLPVGRHNTKDKIRVAGHPQARSASAIAARYFFDCRQYATCLTKNQSKNRHHLVGFCPRNAWESMTHPFATG